MNQTAVSIECGLTEIRKVMQQAEKIKFPNKPGLGIPFLSPGKEDVRCNIRAECSSCRVPSHGFICYFSDGSCLRYPDEPCHLTANICEGEGIQCEQTSANQT